jgi:hypothetical protein
MEVIDKKTNRVLNLKLGYTKNIKKRINQFKCPTGNNINYNIIWVKENVPKQFEHYIHNFLKHYNIPSPTISSSGKLYNEHRETFINDPYIRNLDIDSLLDSFYFEKKMG